MAVYGGDYRTSKIGDYIHYNPKKYKKYGLQFPGQGKSDDESIPEKYLNTVHQNIKAQHSIRSNFGKAKELETRMNWFLPSSKNSVATQQYGQAYQKMGEIITKTAIDVMDRATNNLEFNPELGRFEYKAGLDPSLIRGGKKTGLKLEDRKTSKVSRKAIKERAEKLINAY